ncbi:hypothetical protein [Saccharopolyspora endophytica]|uniref:Uncharacterized protein n=1 Tax=Saccharopolyspora endophytica TaxID=543886 RepID=A0ABS5DQL1_9PSEU|nr:hypothetical protein [Saccharopolyspora endophytica]MBQ0928586.1 hypothetical protein [Saccharopolyspora endophytica]
MNDDLRAQLREDPLVQDFADRVRHCGQPRSFFEALDGSPCPLFISSIRRGYPQRGGTIDADPAVIAGVVIQLAFTPTPTPSLLDRIRAFLRRTK